MCDSVVIAKGSKDKDTIYATKEGLEDAKQIIGNHGWKFNGSIREFVILDPIFGWLSDDEHFELRQKYPRSAP